MDKVDKYKLPAWKMIPSFTSKGVEIDVVKNNFGAIILDLDKESKEILLKLNVDDSHKTHSKTLSDIDVKSLQNVLRNLEGEWNRLTKDGLIYIIIKKMYEILPYKCKDCCKVISKQD